MQRPTLLDELGPGRAVAEIGPGMTAARFERWYRRPGRPVVWRRAAANWTATRDWHLDELSRRYGSRQVRLARVDDGLVTYSEGRGMDYHDQPLASFHDGVASGDRRWFLMLRPRVYFPELQSELGEHPPVAGALWRDTRITIGAAGIMTPIHREFFDNLFTVFSGAKEVVLFSARDSRRLYAHGPLSGVPHMSPVDPRRVDRSVHPRIGRATPHRAWLEPGDALFIPRGWWHVVKTNAPAVAAGMWWANGVRAALPAVASVYKRVMGVAT